MFDFSCADYTFPLLSRQQALTVLHALEFSFVDLGLFERNPHFQPSALLSSAKDFTASVREDLARSQLKVADVFLQVGAEPGQYSTNAPESATRAHHREVFLRALELCGALECAHMTGLPGVDHGRGDADLKIAAEESEWRREQAAQCSVVYSIEPHVGSICATTDAVHRLLKETQGLTLTLDYGHFISAGQDSSSVHPLLRHASHIHARGGSLGHLQSSVAENQIDFAEILARLHRERYAGRIALEYVWVDWEGCNRTDNVAETILLRQLLQRIAGSL